MKNWILILLFAGNHNIFCQEDSATAKINNTHGIRISFGLGASPIWNYIKDKKDDFNLSAGLLTSVNFDNFLELKTGVLVDVIKYSVYEYDLFYTYPIEEKRNEKHYKFQYFRIPTIFNFYFLRKSPLLMNFSIGVVFGIPMYSDSGFAGFRPVDYSAQRNYSAHLGIGMKYYFHKNFCVSFEPFFNRFLNTIIHEDYHFAYSGNPIAYSKFIEPVSPRNYLGAIISINYYLFISSVKK